MNQRLLILLVKKFQLEKERDKVTNQVIKRLVNSNNVVTIFAVGCFALSLRIYFAGEKIDKKESLAYVVFFTSFSILLLIGSFFIGETMLKNPRFFCPHRKLNDEIAKIERKIIEELKKRRKIWLKFGKW